MKKFNIYNETDYNLKKEMKLMGKILKYAIKYEGLKNIYFNCIIVNNDYIHNINKEYRKIDRETDVITFALEDYDKCKYFNKRILGDVYISIEKALEQAKEYNHSNNRELCFLAVHGFLHLLGYDHQNKKDEEIMFKKQELILDGKKYSRR